VHFPRTDPAVIMLVTRGGRALLGRQPSWDPGRYSSLAGFVEPGESPEDAVAREVWEETGVRVRDVRYHSSQPWPFPSSLMVGFTAEAEGDDITVDHDELEDARWFTREEMRASVAAGTILLPAPLSISHRLVAEWLAG
jgi:NAD+ diphosphatase